MYPNECCTEINLYHGFNVPKYIQETHTFQFVHVLKFSIFLYHPLHPGIRPTAKKTGIDTWNWEFCTLSNSVLARQTEFVIRHIFGIRDSNGISRAAAGDSLADIGSSARELEGGKVSAVTPTEWGGVRATHSWAVGDNSELEETENAACHRVLEGDVGNSQHALVDLWEGRGKEEGHSNEVKGHSSSKMEGRCISARNRTIRGTTYR